MKILVLGGSYFLGKSFVNIAKDKHSITVFNRGSRPLDMPEIKEIHGDRHDKIALSQLASAQYDVVVDFCAYEKCDIKAVLDILGDGIKQYIFVSTCDVYERGLGRPLDENSPLEQRSFEGAAGAYIAGKTALENELLECLENSNIAYTAIRPAFIYGPDNYAPREAIYFKWIKAAGQVLYPEDADGEFQMVYVLDVAKAILASIGKEKAYNQAYNLAPPEMQSYASFVRALEKAVDIPFEKVPISVQMVYERNIPLPFPLTKQESNWYDGSKALELIKEYTGLEDGLRRSQ